MANFSKDLFKYYNFNNVDLNLVEISDIYAYNQELIVKIVNDKDECLKQAMIQYAREKSSHDKSIIDLYLLDEDEVKTIIDLGIKEYIKLRNGV